MCNKGTSRKFIAPSTLRSQRPRPFHLFYRIQPWRSLRSLRETLSYPIFPSSRNFKYLWLVLPVDLRRVDVEAADERDQVGDHDALAQFIDNAHRGVGAGADAHPVRVLAAVGNDVKTHVPPRRLDPGVAFACARLALARPPGDGRPLGHHLEALAQDLDALMHFDNAHPVTVVAVAQLADLRRTDRHFEVQLRIDRVRDVAPDIPLDAGAAQVRADQVIRKGILF